jgi:hypothetical protein
MTALPLAEETIPASDLTLVGDVLAHLDAQLTSARSLLELVLEQGAAIRARDVHTVVRLAGILRGEMGRRQLLEEERARLLERSAAALGVGMHDVTLSALCALMDEARAHTAEARSAELRGLLGELAREHVCNRALMQIELGFLDHLMGMLALDGAAGYDPSGSSTSTPRQRPHGALHVLDLRA